MARPTIPTADRKQVRSVSLDSKYVDYVMKVAYDCFIAHPDIGPQGFSFGVAQCISRCMQQDAQAAASVGAPTIASAFDE